MYLNDSSSSVKKTAFLNIHRVVQQRLQDSLWKIMAKYDCPDKLIGIVRKLHDDMMASIRNQQELSDPSHS